MLDSGTVDPVRNSLDSQRKSNTHSSSVSSLQLQVGGRSGGSIRVDLGDVVPTGIWVLTVTAVLRRCWAQVALIVFRCNQLHITTTPIEASPHATTAFGCIVALTLARLKKGKTLITPMDNFTPLTCREALVDHVVFPPCAPCSNRLRRRR